MGDSRAFQYNQGAEIEKAANVGKIENVSIPFCVLHALDDPLVTWRVVGQNPSALVHSGQGNIILLLTKTGGHVGWPVGIVPSVYRWKWMCDAIQDFAKSVEKARKDDTTCQSQESM